MQPWKGNIPDKLFHAHENIKRKKRERNGKRRRKKQDVMRMKHKVLTDLQQEQELLREQT